ncbi:MAG: gephyrin-like molybdotransferase Glp [bacterium]
MITINEARNIVFESLWTLDPIKLPLEFAAGLILSEDIKSDIDVPPFNKATMDGYAIHSADSGVGSELKIDRIIAAGQLSSNEVKRGHAVKIMTGAPVPPGIDSVIMVEQTSQIDEKTVKLESKIESGRNIAVQGEEIKTGDVILKKGTEISAPVAAVLAITGNADVPVYPKPSALILSTGSELIEINKKPGPGQIRESNSYGILTQCSRWSAAASRRPLAADNSKSLKGSIEDALELNPDIIILTGGVSAGDYDLVPELLKEMGVEILFHKVRQKPGKPILFGRTDEQLIFGLPGNPVAAFLGFELYIGPAIRRMMGQTQFETQIHEARLSGDMKVKSDRFYLPQGVVKNIGGEWNMSSLVSKGSADIFTVTKANSFMMLDEGNYVLSAGEKVKFFFIRGECHDA